MMRSRRCAAYIVILVFLAELIIMSGFIYTRVQRTLYPIAYKEYVERYSNEFSVPLSLVYATIKVESNFDSEAVSSAGAVGLMQMMPDTFADMARLCGDTSEHSMSDPEYNIKYGIRYLSYLYSLFERWDYAVLAYNAGPSRVREWMHEDNLDANGRIVDVPYPETEQYLKKIEKTREKYKEIYNQEKSHEYK